MRSTYILFDFPFEDLAISIPLKYLRLARFFIWDFLWLKKFRTSILCHHYLICKNIRYPYDRNSQIGKNTIIEVIHLGNHYSYPLFVVDEHRVYWTKTQRPPEEISLVVILTNLRDCSMQNFSSELHSWYIAWCNG